MTGRPIPTALKIFKGTEKKCRANKNEPKPKADNIVLPKNISRRARKHWEKIEPELLSSGILTNIDQDALFLYCESYAQWDEANENIIRYGLTTGSATGKTSESPYLKIANKAFDNLRKMMIEFGMTPSSRARIKATPQKKENNFDQF